MWNLTVEKKRTLDSKNILLLIKVMVDEGAAGSKRQAGRTEKTHIIVYSKYLLMQNSTNKDIKTILPLPSIHSLS